MRITNSIYLAILIGFIFFSISCIRSDESDLNIQASEYVTLEHDDKVVILDVRTEREYSSGHLENAVLLDVKQPDFKDHAAQLDKELTYYVYCRSGGRSLSAVKYLRSIGINNSYNIQGGIKELSKRGVRIVK